MEPPATRPRASTPASSRGNSGHGMGGRSSRKSCTKGRSGREKGARRLQAAHVLVAPSHPLRFPFKPPKVKLLAGDLKAAQILLRCSNNK